MGAMREMIEIFQEAQKRIQNHAKFVEALLLLYQKTDSENFWESFRQLLLHSLTIFKRELAVERVIEFIVLFATSFKETEGNEERETEERPDLHPFPLRLLNFLLEASNAWDKAVRFRCCQLVSKILKSLGDEVEIDDELFDRIHDRMLERLKDKVPAIRVQAVFAITRLQNPQDKNCPIVGAFQNMLEFDPNSDVRRAVLISIAISTKTLPTVLARTRDTKDVIRQATYQLLAEKVHMRALSIAQRVMILERGLKDRAESVKEMCSSRLLQAWLRVCEGNVLDLLKCLDVENSLEACKTALLALFKASTPQELVNNFDLLNEQKLIEPDTLTVQSVFYWYELCDYLRSLGSSAEEVLDQLLPLPVFYTAYIRSVFELFKSQTNTDRADLIDDISKLAINKLRNDFVLEHLLRLSQLIDFSDEAGRKQYMKLVRELLERDEVGPTVVAPLVLWFKSHQTNVDVRVANLMEIISDIRCPINVVEEEKNSEEQRNIDLKLAAIRMQLNEVRDEMETLVKAQDFVAAAQLKDKVTELESQRQALLTSKESSNIQEVTVEKNDSQTLLKCLTIASEMLSGVPIKTWLPRIQGLVENLIVPCVPNPDPAVRNMALQCLGLSCLLSSDLAKRHYLLFVQASQLDHEVVQVTAIKTLLDLLLIHGVDIFDHSQLAQNAASESPRRTDDNEEDLFSSPSSSPSGKTATEATNDNTTVAASSTVLHSLIEFINSESSDIRTAIVEGLAKLMLSGAVESSALLSRLLLLWYNPLTEEDTRLRSCLGVFFPVYAFSSRSHQQLFEAAFLPTLRALFDAHPTSPLASVNVNNVIDLLVQITNSRHLMSENDASGKKDLTDSNLHDDLALSICNEVLLTPNVFNALRLCRALTLLQLSGNQTRLRELLTLVDRLFKEVKDKQCTKLLERFAKVIREGLGIEMMETLEASEQAEADEHTLQMEMENIAPENTILMASMDADVSQLKRKSGKQKAKSVSSIVPLSNKKVPQSNRKGTSKQKNTLVEEDDDDIFMSSAPTDHKDVLLNVQGNARQTRAASNPVKTRKNLDSVLSSVDNENESNERLIETSAKGRIRNTRKK